MESRAFLFSHSEKLWDSHFDFKKIAVLGVLFATCLWVVVASARGNKNKGRRPPEPSGAWPFIGHLHLLGANNLLHRTLGAMADTYGPTFSIRIGIRRALVISSWEVARECFTTNDRVFPTRPKSIKVKLMGYDHAMFGFAPYGPYWRDIRKLAVVELLSNRRLELLKHIRDSEVNFFIKDLYEQWRRRESGSPVLVEMKERFGDLAMNIIVRMVAGKRYFGTGACNDSESRRCQKAMGDFMYLVGLYMVSDAIPFLGWLDVVKGYMGEMKRTAREVDSVLGSWVEEHQQRRLAGSIDEAEQDFIHVMLSLIDAGQFSGLDANTVVKATCLVCLQLN
ncbi:hypothetical protein L1049_014845 [Liquidambar formosana]|uniref:Cytochrome P450 n=1 Tax=Liquidambar formosana TaxID=63359 RepID=A0AAP0X5P6_LIQFO